MPWLNAADRAVSRYERVQQLYAPLTALVAADRATPLAAARRSPRDIPLRSALSVRAMKLRFQVEALTGTAIRKNS
jgi:hypothetical protein